MCAGRSELGTRVVGPCVVQSGIPYFGKRGERTRTMRSSVRELPKGRRMIGLNPVSGGGGGIITDAPGWHSEYFFIYSASCVTILRDGYWEGLYSSVLA